MDDKKLITLKEAAQLSGYSADYIGQLIRAGKISGKQVYTNISWMTTADDVLAYKNKSLVKKNNNNISTFSKIILRRFEMQYNLVKLFFKTFKFAWPLIIVVLSSFVLLCAYIMHLSFNYSDFPKNSASNRQDQELVF